MLNIGLPVPLFKPVAYIRVPRSFQVTLNSCLLDQSLETKPIPTPQHRLDMSLGFLFFNFCHTHTKCVCVCVYIYNLVLGVSVSLFSL